MCSVESAYLFCRHELKSVPANLIRPKAPRAGKRIFLEKVTFVWRRMKFLHKVSVRNLIRYKKRFFMMILGISGCTALLLTGFGVRDSIINIAGMQYEEILISCRCEESVDLDFGGRTKSVYLEIPEDAEEIGTFLNLHTQGGAAIPYPGNGEAVLTAKVAENMGIKAGDRVTFRDNDMNSFKVTVSALCENFVYNYIYISKETYEEQLGSAPAYKSAYAIVKEGSDIHETADYVFRENLVLTGMGAVVGMGLGKWLHWFVMYNINIDMISFKTIIMPVSYLWSLLLTFAFALMVNGIMYFKLEKINMAEALKSIE